MKHLSILLISLFFALSSKAQTCVLEHWSLNERIQRSDLVIEAHVVDKECIWLQGRRRIYTLYTLEVYKTFKTDGTTGKTLQFVSDGGFIGTEKHEVNPSIHFDKGQTGIFMLQKTSLQWEFDDLNKASLYYPTANLNSFIQYDLAERKAYDEARLYDGFNGYLYTELSEITGPYKRISKAPFDDPEGIKPLSAPSITSWSHDTISAGTGSILTINGSNFGTIKGSTGKVEFRNADFGDGRFYTIPFDDNYISWSNTRIQVKVPSKAGTGTIRLTNSNNESTTSTQSLHIPYAHLNVEYTTGSKFYETDHIDANNKGGYTWRMNHKFKRNQNRVNAMLRSLETWRCNTLVNWEVGADTDSDSIGRDNINVVRITKFSDNKLGVCWSFWSGCWNGNDFDWYATEMDIEFDSTKNWYYGTGTPGGQQFDFETVATHELGHGHQLGHVIDNTKVMHFSLNNGQRKAILNASDVASGDAMMAKSTRSHACGPGVMKAIQQNACNITKPKTDFIISKTIGCPGDMIFLTDASEGVVNSYSWLLDSTASVSSFSSRGPHLVSWSTKGEKTITLITTNSFGSDTLSKTLNILEPAPVQAGEIIAGDTLCIGLNTFSIDSVAGAESYVWNLVSGGLIIGPSNGVSVNASLGTAGGPYTISVKAKNTCGEGPQRDKNVQVIPKAAASFTHSVDGRTVQFSNAAQNANKYIWYFGDGDSSAETNPQHIYRHAWTYSARLFAYNICSVDSSTLEITTQVPANTNETDPLNRISIFPNPVQDHLIIHGLQIGDQLELKDLSGRTLMRFTAENQSTQLDMRNLAKGLYLLHLQETGKKHEGHWKLHKQ